MVVQTTYTKEIRQAINGQIAWDFGTADITSHEAEATIPFGAAVLKGTATNSVKVGNTTDTVKGIATRSLINENAVEKGLTSYAEFESVSVLREGYIYLTNNSAATALAEDEDVYFDAAGLLVASGDSGAVKLIGSRIEQGAAVGALALVRVQINLT